MKADNKDCIVLVPVSHHIEPDCDTALRALEQLGYAVWRAYGFSAIDQGRNVMAQTALDKGYKELMWIDADVVFKTSDVTRLRNLQLPISCGIYGLKDGSGRPAADLSGAVTAGPGLLKISHVGAGFLHTRREVYDKLIVELKLKKVIGRHTNYHPFFLPLIDQRNQYLGEDFAFCHRAAQCGFSIIADTAVKLKHMGKQAFFWNGQPSKEETSNPATLSPIPVELSTGEEGGIAAITCFFNPAKYKTNVDNFHEFKAYMQQIGCPLYAVELAFDEEPFQLEKDTNTFQLRSPDRMWHKERLLNWLVKQLPANITKIIWTDCDLRWPEMPDWWWRTSDLLERYQIVQPFAEAEWLNKTNSCTEFVKEGAVAAYNRHKDPFNFYKFHPGFVWAAKREFFERFGLYDKPILGAGDAYMCFAFLGNTDKVFDYYCDQFSMCKHLVQDYLKWANAVSAYVNKRVIHLDTPLQHRWHGYRADRKYHERMRMIQDFKPAADLVVAANGLYTFAPHVTPAFKTSLADYFKTRNEDGKLASQGKTAIVTAVDAGYFKALPWWVQAVKEAHPELDIIVYDLGMSGRQLYWCSANGIGVRSINPHCFDGPMRTEWTSNIPKRQLLPWIKPFLLRQVPRVYRKLLWVDVDALILTPVPELLAQLNQQAVMFRDLYNPAVTVNHPKLYQLLPIETSVDPNCSINNGVLGIDIYRDAEVFDWWIHCVYSAFRNDEIREAISWWDQGALIWALHKSQRMDVISEEGAKYNHPVNNVKHSDEAKNNLRKDYTQSKDFLAELRFDHPTSNIIHWMGKDKFSLWPKWYNAPC